MDSTTRPIHIFFLYWPTFIRPRLVVRILFRFYIPFNDKIDVMSLLMKQNGKEVKENKHVLSVQLFIKRLMDFDETLHKGSTCARIDIIPF